MTILLILGLIAALYMLWLLFALPTYALPLFVAVSVGLWVHSSGTGIVGSIIVGSVASIATLVAGQMLFANLRSPPMRALIAMLFAVPAAVAGYSAVNGSVGIGLEPGLLRTVLASVGALVIAASAWTRIASGYDASRAIPPSAGTERQNGPAA